MQDESLLDVPAGIDMAQLNLCISRIKISSNITNNFHIKDFLTFLQNYRNIEVVNKLQMDDVKQLLCKKCKCIKNVENDGLKTSDTTINDYINAFCHPDIIVKVREKLLLNK